MVFHGDAKDLTTFSQTLHLPHEKELNFVGTADIRKYQSQDTDRTQSKNLYLPSLLSYHQIEPKPRYRWHLKSSGPPFSLQSGLPIRFTSVQTTREANANGSIVRSHIAKSQKDTSRSRYNHTPCGRFESLLGFLKGRRFGFCRQLLQSGNQTCDLEDVNL